MLKGNKGVCTTGDASLGTSISRTKWNSQATCQTAYSSHLSLGVIPEGYVLYKCKACGFWHFGKMEWATRKN